MTTEADPITNEWYEHLDKGQRFQVVSVDEHSGLIEIQHFDGDVEELEFDDWYEMDLELTEPPENWSGAMDVGELDDLGTSVTDTDRDDWRAPLSEIRPADGEDAETDSDDWGEGIMQEDAWDEDQAS